MRRDNYRLTNTETGAVEASGLSPLEAAALQRALLRRDLETYARPVDEPCHGPQDTTCPTCRFHERRPWTLSPYDDNLASRRAKSEG